MLLLSRLVILVCIVWVFFLETASKCCKFKDHCTFRLAEEKLSIQTCNNTRFPRKKSGGCKRNVHLNKHIRNIKTCNGNISLFGRNLQWNIAYQGRNIIDHVDFKAQTNSKFYPKKRKVQSNCRQNISPILCEISEIVCCMHFIWVGFFKFIIFFFGGGWSNANFMCTFYRISYIYLMHLPMNANRFCLPELKFSQIEKSEQGAHVI